MKKIFVFAYRFLLLCLLLIYAPGCKKILQEDPKTFLDEAATFSNQNGAVSATLGVYQALREISYYGQTLLTMVILHSDEAVGRGSYVPAGNYQLDASNVTRIGNIWTSIYAQINRANLVIEKVPQVPGMDAKLKEQLEGEARFLRALSYYHLVRLWGAVPLRLKSEAIDFSLTRTAAPEVFSQVIEDLKFAENALPDAYAAADLGRATKWAAKILLADVYLTQEKWSESSAKAKEVINSGKFSLVPIQTSLDFQTKIFGPNITTHSEDVFSLKYNATFDNDQFVRFFHKPEPGYAKGGPHSILGNLNSFIGKGEWANENTNDLRRNHTLYSGTDKVYLNASVPMLFRKFRGTLTNVSNATPILRYPEALLIFAEAESQAKSGPTAETYDAVNKVRRRAYGKDYNVVNAETDLAPGMTAQQFRDAVIMERAWEFTVEGKRWFDLLRTNTALTVIKGIGLPITEKNLKWPIPQPELDNNDALSQADQNPGW